MKRSDILRLLFVCAGAYPFTASAQFNASTQPVTAALNLSSPQAAAGKSIKALVHFSIPAPWHIYWKNPGDAGLPTRVIYSLPPDYSAGEIEWPPYQTFKQPGDITAYGYEKDVTLANEITIPTSAKIGEEVPIKASVKWLACSTICIPGSAILEKNLIVSAQ